MENTTKTNPCKTNNKCLKYLTITGLVLLMTPSSFIGICGNLTAYILSYFHTTQGYGHAASVWILPVYVATSNFAYNLTTPLLKLMTKPVLLISVIVLANTTFMLCYISMIFNTFYTYVVLIACFGICVGLHESLVFRYISEIPEEKKGYIISFACSGMSFGAIAMNPIITGYVNPDNLSPNIRDNDAVYFSQKPILDKTPFLHIVIGVIWLSLQLCGYLMLHSNYIYRVLYGYDHQPNNLQDKLNSQVGEDNSLVISQQSHKNNGSINNNNDNSPPITTTSSKQNGDLSFKQTDNLYESKDIDVPPSKMLRSVMFYVLWYGRATQVWAGIILYTYYKTYGELWVQDDFVLTAIGSGTGVVMAVTKLYNGFIMDRLAMKTSLVILFTGTPLCILWMYFTPILDKWVYLFNVFAESWFRSWVYPLFINCTMSLFGAKHFNENHGLIDSAAMVASIVAIPMYSMLVTHAGWFSIFGVSQTMTLFALLLIVLFFPYSLKNK